MEWTGEVQTYLWGLTATLNISCGDMWISVNFPNCCLSLLPKWLEHSVPDATALKSRHPEECCPTVALEALARSWVLSSTSLHFLGSLACDHLPHLPSTFLITPNPQLSLFYSPLVRFWGDMSPLTAWNGSHHFGVMLQSLGPEFCLVGAWSVEKSPSVSPLGSCLPHVQKIPTH